MNDLVSHNSPGLAHWLAGIILPLLSQFGYASSACPSLENEAKITAARDYTAPAQGIAELKRAHSFKGNFADHLRDIVQGPGPIALGFDAGNKVTAVDVSAGKELWSQQFWPQGKQSAAYITDLKVSPDGKFFVVVGGGFFDVYQTLTGNVGTRGHNGPRAEISMLSRDGVAPKHGEEYFFDQTMHFRAEWSRDGSRVVVVATPSPQFASKPSRIMVWDLAKQKLETEIVLEERLLQDSNAMQFSEDGRRLLAMAKNGPVVINMGSGKITAKAELASRVEVVSAAFAPDGQFAAAGMRYPRTGVAITRTAGGEIVEFYDTPFTPTRVEFNAEASALYVFGGKQVVVFDLVKQEATKHLALRITNPVQNVIISDYYSGAATTGVAFSRDKRFLLMEELESVEPPPNLFPDDGAGGRIMFTIGAGSYRISAFPLD